MQLYTNYNCKLNHKRTHSNDPPKVLSPRQVKKGDRLKAREALLNTTISQEAKEEFEELSNLKLQKSLESHRGKGKRKRKRQLVEFWVGRGFRKPDNSGRNYVNCQYPDENYFPLFTRVKAGCIYYVFQNVF